MMHHLTCRSIDSSASNISYPCDVVWGNLFKDLETRLRKLQNWVGIVLLRAAYDVSSKNVLEELGWSDLRTRRAKQEATQMLKLCTGEAPAYLTDKYSKVEARNPYNIRNSVQLNINLLLRKPDFMKRSFAYADPKLWNSLPTCSSTKSVNSLKKDWNILTLMFYYLIDNIVPL